MTQHITKLVALALVALVVAQPLAAAASGAGLNTDSPKTPNPTATVTVEKASHNMSQDVLQYEDDNGNLQTQNGSLTNMSNPVSLRAVDIDRAGAWPNENNSTLDPSEYSTSGNATMDVSTSSGDATGISFAASSVGTNETATATFSNVSVTSDVTKRVLWLAGSVEQLSGVAEVRFEDTDGDYYAVALNDSRSTTETGVHAGQTHGSVVTQANTADLSVQGSGDGSVSEIQSISFVVLEGNVSATFTELSAGRLSKVKYGSVKKDSDGDGTKDLVDLYEPQGRYNVTSLDSLASIFSNGDIYNLKYRLAKSADTAADTDVQFMFDEDAAEEYSRKYIFKQWVRLEFEAAQELTYSDGTITDTVVFPTGRLVEAKFIEGAGSSNFSELDDSSAWNSRATAFENAGDNATVTWDSSPQEGTTYVFYQSWTTDESDKSDMTQSGGAGTLLGGSDGWFEKYILDPINAVVVILLGIFGLRKSGGSNTGA